MNYIACWGEMLKRSSVCALATGKSLNLVFLEIIVIEKNKSRECYFKKKRISKYNVKCHLFTLGQHTFIPGPETLHV